MRRIGLRNIALIGTFTTIVIITISFLIPQSRYYLVDQFGILTGHCLVNGTCITVTSCGNNNSSNIGCPPGKTYREWRDPILKSRYREITSENAKQCLFKFIEENKNKYTKLQHVAYSTLHVDNSSSSGWTGNFDKADKNFWYFELSTEQNPSDKYHRAYGLTFQVGAQTCKVYPDKFLDEPF